MRGFSGRSTACQDLQDIPGGDHDGQKREPDLCRRTDLGAIRVPWTALAAVLWTNWLEFGGVVQCLRGVWRSSHLQQAEENIAMRLSLPEGLQIDSTGGSDSGAQPPVYTLCLFAADDGEFFGPPILESDCYALIGASHRRQPLKNSRLCAGLLRKPTGRL